jgi:hypothetical protein
MWQRGVAITSRSRASTRDFQASALGRQADLVRVDADVPGREDRELARLCRHGC